MPDERELGTPSVTGGVFGEARRETFTQLQLTGMQQVNREATKLSDIWGEMEKRAERFFDKAVKRMQGLTKEAKGLAGGTNAGGGHSNYSITTPYGPMSVSRGNGGGWQFSAAGAAGGGAAPPPTGGAPPRGGGGGGFFRRTANLFSFGGPGPDDDLQYLAARQAVDQLSGYARGIGRRYEGAAADFGLQRSYLAVQTQNFSGGSYNQAVGRVSQLQDRVGFGWRSNQEFFAATQYGQQRLRGFVQPSGDLNAGLANRMGVLSSFAPEFGGLGGTYQFFGQLQTPQMQAQLAPFGGGQVLPGGRMRTPGGTLAQLSRIATGMQGGQFGEGALGVRSLQATFGEGGIGRANLMARGFSPEQIDVIQRYSVASARAGRALSFSNAGDRKDLGISRETFARQTEIGEQARSRKDLAGFDAAEDQMVTFERRLAQVNDKLRDFNEHMGGWMFWLGKGGQAVGSLINGLSALGGLLGLKNILLGGSGGAGLIGGAGRLLGIGGGAAASGATAVAAGGGAAALGMGGLAIGASVVGKKIGSWINDKTGGVIRRNVRRVESWFNPWGDGSGDIGDGSLPGPGRSAGLHGDFISRLQRMFAENPRLQLTSGFRTYEEQSNLYANRRSNRYPVARPGTSRHESGRAADVGPQSELGWVRANAQRFGLTVPMPDRDPVHVEMSGGVTGQGSRTANSNVIEEPPELVLSGGQGGLHQGLRFDVSGQALLEQFIGGGKLGSFSGGFSSSGAAIGAGVTGAPDQATPGPTSGGGTLSAAQIIKIARSAGFSGEGLRTAVAVALGESGGNTRARNVNKDKTRSVDRGLWQINSRWHPEVSDSQADDPFQAAQAAFRISSSGSSWSPWSVYKSGAYRRHLGAVDAALAGGAGDATGDFGAGMSISIASLTLHVAIDNVSEPEAQRLFRLFELQLKQAAAERVLGAV